MYEFNLIMGQDRIIIKTHFSSLIEYKKKDEILWVQNNLI